MDSYYLRLPQVANITDTKRHTLNARLRNLFDSSELKRNSANQILLHPNQTRQIIDDRILPHKGKIIYIGNLKGGVGKTTLAYLISNSLSLLGLKVCVLDLDVQANITRQYVNISPDQPVFYDVIDEDPKSKKNIKDVIIKVSENLDIIPSSLKNSLIERVLTVQGPKHQLNWFNSICLKYLRGNYDVVVVDTPPHLTTLNSVLCLCLTDNDHVVIPVCAEDFSDMGVQMFLEDITGIRQSYQVKQKFIISIIMNRFFQNQKTNLEMLVKMGQKYQGMLSEAIIRDNAKIREMMNNKIWLSDIKKGKEIYEILASLLKELKIIKET